MNCIYNFQTARKKHSQRKNEPRKKKHFFVVFFFWYIKITLVRERLAFVLSPSALLLFLLLIYTYYLVSFYMVFFFAFIVHRHLYCTQTMVTHSSRLYNAPHCIYMRVSIFYNHSIYMCRLYVYIERNWSDIEANLFWWGFRS